MAKWIPIDQQPLYGKKILLSIPGQDGKFEAFVTDGYFEISNKTYYWVMNDGFYEIANPQPTHWMEYPKPYGEYGKRQRKTI